MFKRRMRHGGGREPIGRAGQSDRWESKRQRFAGRQPGQEEQRKPSRLSTYLAIGGVVLIVVFVGLMTFSNSGSGTTAAAPIQQVLGTTTVVEGGRVSISAAEVASSRLVAWDYKKGNVTTPLLAYATPSGALKIASRMCEPCNSTSFRIEGDHLVCNACGSRWELETSRGILGGCLNYPPDLLPSTVEGGRLSVDEQEVANWKPRV